MSPQHEYVDGQFRPHFADLLADLQRRSDAAAAAPTVRLDLAYGPHVRQRFDHFPALGEARGALLFFHAGYWQSRDKANFRFLAGPFQAVGLHFFAINYPLCPEFSLAQIEQAVLASVAAVRGALQPVGADELPLAVAGHSAGGHLAALLALAGQPVAATATADPAVVDGVWGISGVYDPEPLLGTTLNERLKLDTEAARRANVSRRVRPQAPPGLWMVGGAETASFASQNADMHMAWSRAGNASRCCTVAGADHFTVLASVTPGASGAPDASGAFEAWWAEVAAFHRARHQGAAARD
jgi:arylformamidase